MEKREDQILRAAVGIFGSRGYERTSLQDIADVVGVTKPALYYYFRDKDTLYARVVVEALRQLVDYVEARVSRHSEPEDRLREFLMSAATFLGEHRETWLLASGGFWSAATGDYREEALRLRDHFEGMLRDALAQAISAGALRSVDVALAGRLLLSGLNQMHRWHSPDGPLSVVEVADRYLDFVLNGLRAERPAAVSEPPAGARRARRARSPVK
ncbi:TetR/AcrR family transcriptional regulator [Verticiella sediminum]|uniref:TetR/AcrR family transcriptional regulator n=1 Tax=Verticiella sediminum TaxID=1247510 RepID=A0A556APN6_9BURK|nr:TetR/AcrR family transcriptional regulator [Verticiella sediminum]TSH94855.1 TetR/AcrR family transcriptional regulator [Verticiella sediminum]